MAKVIGVSGKKQSGKTSLAYYLKALILQSHGMYNKDDYSILQDEEGNVFFTSNDPSYSPVEVKTIKNEIVEVYSFGDALKELCIYTLGLTWEQCYGTDENKNTLTNFKWDNFPMSIRKKYSNETKKESDHASENSVKFGFSTSRTINVPRTGQLTAREIMQVAGTDIFREMFDDNIWVDSTFSRIKRDKVKIAIIADVRFPSEVYAIKNQIDHNIVRLNKNNHSSDSHPSEISLDNFKWEELGDKVLLVDNKNLEMQTKNDLVYDWLLSNLGSTEIKKETVNG